MKELKKEISAIRQVYETNNQLRAIEEMKLYGRELTDEEREAKYAEKEAKKLRLEQEKIAQAKAIKNEEKKAERIEAFKLETPKRYKGATIDNFICSNESQRIVKKYIVKARSLILFGDNGDGKTRIGFSSCLYQVERGKTVKRIVAIRFFDEIRMSFAKGGPEEVVDKYAKYDYLIIDELDKTQGSRTEFVYLSLLVDQRYNDMLPTILIANAKTKADIYNILGGSIYDRIAGEGRILEMKRKESYRLKERIQDDDI